MNHEFLARTVWAFAENFSSDILSTMGYLLVVVKVHHALLFFLCTFYQPRKVCSPRSGSLVRSAHEIVSEFVSFERAHWPTSKTAFKSLCDSKLAEKFLWKNLAEVKKCSLRFSISDRHKSVARPGGRWGSAPTLKKLRLMRTLWVFSLTSNMNFVLECVLGTVSFYRSRPEMCQHGCDNSVTIAKNSCLFRVKIIVFINNNDSMEFIVILHFQKV